LTNLRGNIRYIAYVLSIKSASKTAEFFSQGSTNSGKQNFVPWHLKFVASHCRSSCQPSGA